MAVTGSSSISWGGVDHQSRFGAPEGDCMARHKTPALDLFHNGGGEIGLCGSPP